MTTPKPLSPAAQAVMDAYRADWQAEPSRQDCKCLAAALRAAAGQMIKTDDLTGTFEDIIRGAERVCRAAWLHTIATELEGHHA